MGRGGSATKPKKRKKVTVQLIKEKHAGDVTEPYRLLAEIRGKEHGHLAEAKIGLAWRLGWRADADGRMTLGQCRKRGDLDRELDGFDFIILLNKEAWERLNEKQKRALIDHELCHASIVIDSDGSPKKNDRDRLVTRIKKHNCEEFRDVVERHGLWKQDLEAFATAAINDAQRPLIGESEKAEAKVGENGQAKTSPAEAATDAPTDTNASTTELAPSAAPDDSWKKYGLAAAAFEEKHQDALESAGIHTLGELQSAMNRHGQYWARDLKVGKFRQAIEDNFNRYLTEINAG